MAAGIMVPPLSDVDGDFGWSMGTIGAVIASYYLFGAIYAPMTGWLGDRYGSRWMLFAASVMYLISMFLLSQVTEIWHFFIFFGILLSLTQSLAMVPLMAAVSGWFRRRLGLGVGILWGAGGVGTGIIAPLMGGFIEFLGWQNTFMLIGGVGGGIMLAMVPLMRSKPADIGIQPYGARDTDPPPILRDKTVDRLRQKVFNQHTRRTKPFWNLPLIHGLGCAGHGIILIYSIPLAMQQGISLVTAAWILSLISLFSVISRFVSPILTEEFGGKAIMVLAMFIQGITVLSLFWASDVWMFYMFGIFFGMGFGGEMSTYLVVNRQYFGHGPIATTYGFQMMGALIGHGIAVGISGLVLYVVDSYNALLILSMAFSFAGSAIVLLLEPSKQLLIPNWENSLPPEARTQHLTTEAH